jgi:hypothetical protein
MLKQITSLWDEIIEIDLPDWEEGPRVRATMMSQRSELLKAEVEKVMARNPKPRVHRTLRFSKPYMNVGHALMYLNFIYGQPIWIRLSKRWSGEPDIDEDWRDLVGAYELSMHYKDYDAADAALDGMRNLLEQCRDTLKDPFGDWWREGDFELPYGRLILDYMVHKACSNFREWREVHEHHIFAEDDIVNELSKRFAEESQRKADGTAEPDLMERCRYHLHVEKGTPCYLNK